jgi:hypothetical protein
MQHVRRVLGLSIAAPLLVGLLAPTASADPIPDLGRCAGFEEEGVLVYDGPGGPIYAPRPYVNSARECIGTK